jgi:hypothetical protein
MTWDEIRAAYPPDTWLVLELTQREWEPPWQHFEPVRVLDVVPPDSDPSPCEQKHRAMLPHGYVIAFRASDDALRAKPYFNGLSRFVEPAPDMGGPAPVVVDLRARRRHRDAAGRG